MPDSSSRAPSSGERLLLDLVEELPDPLRARVHAVPEEAPAAIHARADVRPQRHLEALGLHEVPLKRAERRVERAVENEPAHPAREQPGVGRADEGAVGRPEVAQLLVPERRPEDVDVLGHLDRGHVPGQVTALPQAAVAEILDQVVGVLRLGRGVRVGVGGDQLVELLVADALQRRARADAPRVEADDVEGRQHLGAEARGRRGCVVDTGDTWAARVHDQRPDAALLAGGGDLEQRQADLPSTGVGVVERHLQGRALVAVAAALPGQLLVVELRQLGRAAGARVRPGRVDRARGQRRLRRRRLLVLGLRRAEEAATGQQQREYDEQHGGSSDGTGHTVHCRRRALDGLSESSARPSSTRAPAAVWC